MTRRGGPGGFGLRLIGGFKFLSGLLLAGLGVEVLRHAKDDPTADFEYVAAVLKLDPGNRFIHAAIEKVSGIKPSQLRAIGAGTFFYALIYLVEGGGLLLRKHWAEYLTVVATGLFVPVELYEVYQRPTPLRISVLAINLAIVVYLIVQIARRRGDREGPGGRDRAVTPGPVT